MKICLEILGLSFSLVVSALCLENPQGTLELDNPLSGKHLVNIFSFQPQPPVLGGLSSMDDMTQHSAPSSILKPTPFSDFFRTTKSVQLQSENEMIKLMAHEVLSLIDTLGPGLESWSMWLQRNEDLVTRICWLAEDALQTSDKCSEGERLWAVGILAALFEYLPTNADGITSYDKFKFFKWSAQVWIEVEASREFKALMTKHFMSVWLDNISREEAHPDLKECLERAHIFGEEMHGVLASNILIPSSLLRSRLPVSQAEVDSLVKYFHASLKEINLFDDEMGVYLLFLHLLEHSPQFKIMTEEHIQDHQVFMDMNRPSAQNGIQDYLYEAKEINLVEVDLGAQIIACAKGRTPSNSIFGIVDLLAKKLEEAAIHEYNKFTYIYLILVSLCFIHPSAEYYFRLKYIEKDLNVPYFLARTWFEYYQDLEVSKLGDGEYVDLLLIQNPSYLQDVRRHFSAINMKQSTSKHIQDMGNFLICLPRVTGRDHLLDEALDSKISDQFDEVVHVLQSTFSTPSVEPIQEIAFELLYYLKEYKEDWELMLVDRMKQVQEFQETIIHSATSVIKRNLETWKEQPGNFHIPKSELHGFIKRLVDYSAPNASLWKQTSAIEKQFKSQKRKSEWLSHDEHPIVLQLFQEIPFSINPRRIRRLSLKPTQA